jgi:hypothetical protein
VGALLKVQAKTKLDQIPESPASREGVVQDMRLEVWSRSIEGGHNRATLLWDSIRFESE